MIIGVDATSWQNNRGYGRHARSLLTSLVRLDQNNQYVYVLDSEKNIDAIPKQVETHLIRSNKPTTQAASADSRRSIVDMFKMSKALSDQCFDILFFPTIYSYVPVFSRAKKLVMIHDVIAEKYPQLTFPKVSSRLFWKLKGIVGRSQADMILTVSEYSRYRIAEHFQMSPERIRVVGEASDPIFKVIPKPVITREETPCLDALQIPLNNPLIVYVGGFGPHKNLGSLVDVFARLVAQPEFSDTRLVLVGEYRKEVFYSEYHWLSERINQFCLSDRVIFTGYLPDEELVVLLNLSTLLVLPSFMEGFGLPAIEAAACGCPVIATKESPLPSLLGNACIYVDPENPLELLTGFIDVLGSKHKRMEMSQAGIIAAGRYTWDNAALEFIGIIESLEA